MIQEGIQKIVELANQANDRSSLTKVIEGSFDGAEKQYEFKIKTTANGPELGDVIQPFRPAKLQVSTLTGFIDAIDAGVGGELGERIVHVEDFGTVSLKAAYSDFYGVRDTLLIAKYVSPGDFQFDEFQSAEKFLIGLETCFLRIDGDDSEYVKILASNLKGGDSVHSQDDGVNQTVTLKVGQVETAEKAVKARVKLTPIRTFDEAAPVQQEFLLRFKPNNSGLPLVALYSLGGTRWKSESMHSIKRYLDHRLKDKHPDLPILA